MSSSPYLNGQNLKNDSLKKIYVPTNIHVQFAGNIGMISIGPTWSFFDKKVDFELSIGYVPKLEAKQAIITVAIKGLYTPNFDFKIKEVHIKPFSIGAALSYTFGERFSKYQDPNKYSNNYYWWNISYRYCLLYQAEVYHKINHKQLKGISFYFELSVWDLDFSSFVTNSNSSYLSLWDITTLGIGTKIYF